MAGGSLPPVATRLWRRREALAFAAVVVLAVAREGGLLLHRAGTVDPFEDEEVRLRPVATFDDGALLRVIGPGCRDAPAL